MTLILTFVAVVNWLKLLDYLLLMLSLGLQSAPIVSLKTLNTMLLLQMIPQDLHGFILYIISLATSLLIACLKNLWKDNLVQRFNVFKLMEEASLPVISLRITQLNMAFFTMYHVHTLLHKMVWSNIDTEPLLKQVLHSSFIARFQMNFGCKAFRQLFI